MPDPAVVDPAVPPVETPPAAPAPKEEFDARGAFERLGRENRELKNELRELRESKVNPEPKTPILPEDDPEFLAAVEKNPKLLLERARQIAREEVGGVTARQAEADVARLLNGHKDAQHADYPDRIEEIFNEFYPGAFSGKKVPTPHQVQVVLKQYDIRFGVKANDKINPPVNPAGSGGGEKPGEKDVDDMLDKAKKLMADPKTYEEGRKLKAAAYKIMNVNEDDD